MATLAENNAYLLIDGVVVNTYFKSVSFSRSNAPVDVTAGSGVDWVERAPGLNDSEISIVITYDTSDIQAYIQHIAPGLVASIEYGPESNVSGKPRHVQSFLITAANPSEQNVSKAEVTFAITGQANGAPSVDMFAGGVYA